MIAEKAGPEEKYRYDGHNRRNVCTLRMPLREGTIRVRTGWFTAPSCMPRFKIGDGETVFPFVPSEDEFSVMIGRLGKFAGNQGVTFADNKEQVLGLVMAAVSELRAELERAEEACGGFEYLSRRKKKYSELREASARLVIEKEIGKPLEAWTEDDYKVAHFNRMMRSTIRNWALRSNPEPSEEQMRLSKEIEKFYPDMNAFHGLELRAKAIRSILSEAGGRKPANYAIIIPDALSTVPLVSTFLQFYRDRSLRAYTCSLACLDSSNLFVYLESDRKAILLGNQVKILIGP